LNACGVDEADGRQFIAIELLDGETLRERKVRYTQPMALTWVYSGLHEREATLQFLEDAYAERDPHLIAVDPQIDFVLDDPRFQRFCFK
jgi:hypothetical protein